MLFSDAVQSACGGASSAVGPFYCPGDSKVYVDLSFFNELSSRFGASGDFAMAYVIAHEVGHHVQQELGLLNRADRSSIETELQADCSAGLWLHSLRDQGIFTEEEIKEALDAAAAVGDDRIQEKVIGYINPETWTHGSSQQRVRAFQTGYEQGTITACGY